MARIRSIKPEFFRHNGLAELPPLHRLLFQGLWTLADREGRLQDRPSRIKIETLPYDTCDVDTMLNDLVSHPDRFIVRYKVCGEKFIQIVNFLLHQRPHHKEPKSFIPPIPSSVKIKKSIRYKAILDPLTGLPLVNHDSNGLAPHGPDPLGREGKGMDKGKGVDMDHDLSIMTVERVVAEWNAMKRFGIVPILSVQEPIRQCIDAIVVEHPQPEWWKEFFGLISSSHFLTGKKKDFAATLDWVLDPKNSAKILAGNYGNRPAGSGTIVAKVEEPACNFHSDGTRCDWRVSSRTGGQIRCRFHAWCERHNVAGSRDQFINYIAVSDPTATAETIEALWVKANH